MSATPLHDRIVARREPPPIREGITPGTLSTPSERARARRGLWRTTVSPFVERMLRGEVPPK